MSTSTHEFNDSKVPSNLERRTALLARVKAMEEEKESIQRELTEGEYAQILSTPSIHTCPDEVLLHIFKCYLKANHDDYYKSQHSYIRRLLLICKRWNHLVANTKNLWAQIEIKDGYDLFDFPNRKSLLPYVDACFERSEDLPLDVELDLRGLPNFGEYIVGVVFRSDERILEDSDHLAVSTAIQEADPNYRSDWYELQLKKALNTLFDVEGNATLPARYGKLKLTLPEDPSLREEVLKKTGSPAPTLELPVLERLKFDGSANIQDFHISPANLKHLSMNLREDLLNLDALSSLPQLRTLDISIFQPFESEEEPRIIIELPVLHSLTMFGRYNHLRQVDFRLPSLELLTADTWTTRSRLPKLSPRRIVWCLDYAYHTPLGKADMVSLARDIIMLSPTTETITVPKRFWKEVLTVLADYGEECPDSALKHVIFSSDSDDGQPTRIDVRDKEAIAKMMDNSLDL